MFSLALMCLSLSVWSQTIKVMSYNIRVDFGGDGPNNWEFRRDMLAGQIQFYAPDFIGTQEGKVHQLQYLDEKLPQHTYLGISRDNSKTEGEFSAIFYNTAQFKPIENHTFWLSETPDRKSKGWDAAYERICTYALFENRKTKQRIWVFNTHLDHMGQTARQSGVKLILEKITQVNPKKLPVIFTGDFNSGPESAVYQMTTQLLQDSKKISLEPAFGPSGTFNAFQFDKPVVQLLDYIFVQNIKTVAKHAVLSDSQDCRYPSDHLPVYAEIKI